MIVLCGIPSEPPLQAVIAAAERRGVEFAVFNQRRSHHADLVLENRPGGVGGSLRLDGVTSPIDRIRGVFVRLMDVQNLPYFRPRGRWNGIPDAVQRAWAFQEAFVEWLEVARCQVLNRPGRMASNMSKPYQALLIRRCGFRVPATVVTNDPETVRAFAATHKRVVYKSTSAVRSIVQDLTSVRRRDLERVRDLPTQFQEYIPGVNVRVHTVGRRLFATEIRSDVVDYRYASSQGASVTVAAGDLPGPVAERCFALAQALELPFAGIDLKRTPEGEYYCFEVNPSPAYTYYEEHTGQPIADAIVEHLATGA